LPKLSIIDDVLAPELKLGISYKGRYPFRVCERVANILKVSLKIETKNVYTDHLKWDVTGDPRGFYGIYRAKHENDRWSNTWVKAVIQGEQGTDGNGWVKITLKAWVETEFEYSNFLQRSLWFLFNRLFYYEQRRYYMDEAKDFTNIVKDRLAEVLEIPREEL